MMWIVSSCMASSLHNVYIYAFQVWDFAQAAWASLLKARDFVVVSWLPFGVGVSKKLSRWILCRYTVLDKGHLPWHIPTLHHRKRKSSAMASSSNMVLANQPSGENRIMVFEDALARKTLQVQLRMPGRVRRKVLQTGICEEERSEVRNKSAV